MEWVVLMHDYCNDEAEEPLFEDMGQLARQLEYYRTRFVPTNPQDREKVNVHLYSDNDILITDEQSGEHIRITKNNQLCKIKKS